jgi:hypothetical protein
MTAWLLLTPAVFSILVPEEAAQRGLCWSLEAVAKPHSHTCKEGICHVETLGLNNEAAFYL